jgi:hypothetical protein
MYRLDTKNAHHSYKRIYFPKTMDYNELQSEFDRIFALPLWQRPIEIASLAKARGISKPDARKAFDLFSGQKYREQRSESGKNICK